MRSILSETLNETTLQVTVHYNRRIELNHDTCCLWLSKNLMMRSISFHINEKAADL